MCHTCLSHIHTPPHTHPTPALQVALGGYRLAALLDSIYSPAREAGGDGGAFARAVASHAGVDRHSSLRGGRGVPRSS